MRKKDKIEKYLDRLIKKHKDILQESELSRYYSIRGSSWTERSRNFSKSIEKNIYS